VYKNSPERLRRFMQDKVLQAKKYLSKNRLRVTMDECDQLACELQQLVQNNRPYDENRQHMQMAEYRPEHARSATCCLL